MRRLLKRRLQLLAVLATLVALCSVAVLTPFAGGHGRPADKRFAIGFRLGITGFDQSTLTGSAQGPFSAAGAISDTGNSNANFRITPTGNDQGTLEGTQTFTRSPGDSSNSITAHFRGTTGPLSAPRATGRGRFRIVSGTGVYAGLRGRGRFLVIADFTTNSVTGTYNGRVRGN